MQGDYEQCKLMMKVSDKELEVFSIQRQKKEQLRIAREAGRKELDQ